MKKKTAAIVLAGGRGTRTGRNVPKQYINVGGYPLLYYSLKTISDSFIDEIILVCGEADRDHCMNDIVEKYHFTKVKSVVVGGRERYHSVYNGLTTLRCIAEGDSTDPCGIVFIHDGARPFVSEQILTRAYEAAEEFGAAVVAMPARDTVKLADDNGFAIETLDRNSLWLMQTPQAFDFYDIYDAYSKLIAREAEFLEKGVKVTDDAMVLELFSDKKIKLVEGDARNFKVTTEEDLDLVGRYL